MLLFSRRKIIHVSLAEWSKAVDSSSIPQQRAWVRPPQLTLLFSFALLNSSRYMQGLYILIRKPFWPVSRCYLPNREIPISPTE